MIILLYTVITLSTAFDEIYNITHPRPNPKQKYYCLQWEKLDFYHKKINNEWILLKYRKTDSPTKKLARAKYWKKLEK